jgi:hypothetical protein
MAKRLVKPILFFVTAAIMLLVAGNAWTKSPVATNATATPIVGLDSNAPSGFATNPVTGLIPNPVFGLTTNAITGFTTNIIFLSTTNTSLRLTTNITVVISNNMFLGFVTNVFPMGAVAPNPFANRSTIPTLAPQPVLTTNLMTTIPTNRTLGTPPLF